MGVGVMRTAVVAEMVWMLKVVMEIVKTDVLTVSIAIWPWTHAWKPATSDGVKKTVCLAEIVMKMVAQNPATWNNVKTDALTVWSATWLDNLAWKPVTSDGAKTTA